MRYDWPPQPVHVEAPGWLIHLAPARDRGKLIVKRRDGERWRVVARYEGPLAQVVARFEAELSKRCIVVDDGRAWVDRETGRTWGVMHQRWFDSLEEWRRFFAGRAARHCGDPLTWCPRCGAWHEGPACAQEGDSGG